MIICSACCIGNKKRHLERLHSWLFRFPESILSSFAEIVVEMFGFNFYNFPTMCIRRVMYQYVLSNLVHLIGV